MTQIAAHQHGPYVGIRKARADIKDVFEALATKLEPGLARTIRYALEEQANSITVDAIAKALESGDIGKVLALLDLPAAVAPLEAIAPAVQNAVYAAGAAAALEINKIKGVSFVFNQLNPRLLTWLQVYSLGLIQQINVTTKEAVRGQLLAGMTAGKHPKSVAVQIKQTVGLTERQAKAVANFRAELESFHMKRNAGGWGLGSKVNRRNGTQIWIVGDDGQSTDGILDRRLRDYRFDGQLRTAMVSGKPLSPEKVDKMVAAYHRKYLAYRARTIARTEAIRANNIGIQDAWVQAAAKGVVREDLLRKRWFVGRDERTCEICAPIPGMNPKRGVKLSASFTTPDGPISLPPVHPNCLPAGTLVSAGSGIAAATARWYEGELAVIRTAGGKKVSATVNHPILTVRGWVGAGFIEEGDRVVSRAGIERLAAQGKDNENVPTPIENVARARFEPGTMTTVEVPVAAEDFHGDGLGSKVAVVRTNRLLHDERDAALRKQFSHTRLVMTVDETARSLLARFRLSFKFILGALASGSGSMSSGNLSFALVGTHRAPLDPFRLGSTADSSANRRNAADDDASADAALAREIIDGATGPVAFDEVVEVSRIPFVGHVYNLETGMHHYTANGLITHNCRCSINVRLWEPEQLQGN